MKPRRSIATTPPSPSARRRSSQSNHISRQERTLPCPSPRKREGQGGYSFRASLGYSFTEFSRNALAMTLTELSAMAAAASIGESSQPVSGYSTPAATGMPSAL